MNGGKKEKQKILIVDDSEINRSILADMLGEEYETLEAENGSDAVRILQKRNMEINLVLLDAVMPCMDGFEVLAVMNQKRWIEGIPVIMITTECDASMVERAYDLGVTDFITRPFDALIVHRRVVNTLLLYAKQKKLVGLVAEQIYEKERTSGMLIDMLSHMVEFRNGESGEHIRRVRTLTEILLRKLQQDGSIRKMTKTEITHISTASALHDIGKIAIDERILNKPGSLTEEELSVMKTHSIIGAEMLARIPAYQSEPLFQNAYEICRWHHERYDGRGYPDGLKGDEIPISAQVVALADAYDTLTRDRVYKGAIPHKKAIQMILDGECGAFNPKLMNCLRRVAGSLEKELAAAPAAVGRNDIWDLAWEMIRQEGLTASERSLRLLDHERMKYNFFAAITEEIQFEYSASPPLLTLSEWGAKRLGIDEVIMNPQDSEVIDRVLGRNVWQNLSDRLRNTTPDKPVITYDCQLRFGGQTRWHRVITQAIWSADEPPQCIGAIGKTVDIHDTKVRMKELEKRASHDTLTGLLNHASAKLRVIERIEKRPDHKFALVIFDLDRFKQANDTHGHMFGDQVLRHVAQKLKKGTRSDDIVARVGGDEFLIFLEYEKDVEPIVERIFRELTGTFEDFPISVSLGVACTAVVGIVYDRLFHAADQALYSAKEAGRGRYCFYDPSMDTMFSRLSPIDSESNSEMP